MTPAATHPGEELLELDRRRVWHPYTPMQQYLAEGDALVITAASGSRLHAADGRSYLDGNSSWWAALLGHGHPRLCAALRRQSEIMCHVALAGIVHEPAARLAEELCALAPAGLERVFFSDDGSTAVEVALKLCLKYWVNAGAPERKRFAALEGAFHGDTLAATMLGGVELFRRPYGASLLDCVHLPLPSPPSGAERAYEALARLFSRPDELAAVIVEPLLQGAAGMRIYPAEYLRELRRLCDRHEVLLIADEVFTGYGRSGSMWACEEAGVVPDLMCLAKGLSGGMLPMGATLVNERVFAAFLGEPERAFHHGHTYGGNPLAAAVAREVLAVYRDEDIVSRARPKALRIRAAFERMATRRGVSAQRSMGMVGALDLAAGGGYLGGGGWQVYREALRRGAYLRPLGDVVYVAPPLNIADDDLDELLAIVDESLAAVAA
jgi:adenosylmethionine-8-amino-7-oxononanoate aminotransferase